MRRDIVTAMRQIEPILEVLFAAAVGAAAATIIDYLVSADRSLVYGLSVIIDRTTDYAFIRQMPLFLAAVASVVFGTASVFYFRPLNRKGAFACGFAAVAALNIFIP